MGSKQKIIGILALQGDFDAHRKLLHDRLSAPTAYVRTPEDLARVDALILPGGESTTQIKLMMRTGLDGALRSRLDAGMPAYGTCAGMILLANKIQDHPEQPTLGSLDITVARNAFGRQVDSFEADIPFPALDNENQPVHGVFIRAPYVVETCPNVEVLAHYQDKIVAVRQGSILATAFHPELTDDDRVHSSFLEMVAQSREKRR